MWVPMPFPVLIALLRAMHEHGVFAPPTSGRGTIIDAGAGDGRALAALAHFLPDSDIVGIESDEGLYHRAVANVDALGQNRLVSDPERLRMIRGDYRARETYGEAGVHLDDVGFVFNYPDGNEAALERFVIESSAPGTKLCLLTHDGDLRLTKLELTSKETIMASAWHWSVYSS